MIVAPENQRASDVDTLQSEDANHGATIKTLRVNMKGVKNQVELLCRQYVALSELRVPKDLSSDDPTGEPLESSRLVFRSAPKAASTRPVLTDQSAVEQAQSAPRSTAAPSPVSSTVSSCKRKVPV
ncbi:hypothetical protein GN244_ATG13581 [Phytophthora infestans]|uniref:Uncharacterized protein n=1 Tax=Phytophthora infestans TaxID=4787 RepID=A0A833SP08_PHYIN|nr:hypothetical protein GN244_ATG13581 [Phytophthora infestans]